MKIFNPSRKLILATTIFLVFIVPLRAQDSPQDFLDAHNQARAAVGVDPLAWDETWLHMLRTTQTSVESF
ncbi:unnamed protein product [Brassica oleracea]|uniref:(rape) hypothetical protein n=1 Tax=Brassica napus TaxID=3708 RepID=A0A816NGI4_BRANA|nr:unnamed protein product [Brassica napus]